MGRKYPGGDSGKWIRPIRKGYRLRCCDCDLVHSLDFRVVKEGKNSYLEFRVFRDNRSTAACRRKR